ncbi:transcriptional regulator [Microtetraspora sp. NBRC 13810]|uniref:GntR family transcriptional regulator n=1 Tax=Microtetraspora sp. NBRC 13810 TaxID=3030990 RepID=UPI002557C3E6|nr:GntR family transcriptional regulator [Microtetraspora sp. NBRC 13810]GLW10108.1 transcriptional regulator [Microtetraspora sp. NBRC 13810]
MTETHAYLRIADQLREMIHSGDLTPGDRLPAHRALADEYEVSEILIRRAIDLLRTEGLVESRRGSGTFVRARPAVRRISMDRYRVDAGPQHEPATSFTADQGITWSQYRLDKAFRWVEATAHLADLFGVEPGVRVLERRFVFYSKGEPSQMSRSCLLAADVEGTPVADPKNEPWPGGNIGQLRTLGIVVDEIVEETAVRMPTPEEVAMLGIGTGVPVFAITRQMLAANRVVEVADPITIPGDRAVRVDRIRPMPE